MFFAENGGRENDKQTSDYSHKKEEKMAYKFPNLLTLLEKKIMAYEFPYFKHTGAENDLSIS